MSAIFDVTQGGLGNTVQDRGRVGYRHQGVPVSGCLDTWLASCANALAGNASDTAVLELRALGPTLKLTQGTARLALCGQVSAKLTRASGLTQPVATWCGVTLHAGDTLHIGHVADGCAYLACATGWDGSAIMGSRATYARVGLGGIHGRALQTGDRLCSQARADASAPALRATQPFTHPAGPVRVMLGPQADHFTPEALQTLVSATWQATSAQDRMGVRLSGPRLNHVHRQAADIVSDGIAAGAIQVPADGQPIVLLADCQTMGGYPKIATVIAADLPRMAHLPAGCNCQFAAVDARGAHAALLSMGQAWQAWRAGLKPYAEAGWVDADALYQHNLIDGMINAIYPE
jgi:5-oxoprolinase (ATP-hydrolysing) subunit C